MDENKPTNPPLDEGISSFSKDDPPKKGETAIPPPNKLGQTDEQSVKRFKQERQLKFIEQLPKFSWFLLVVVILFIFSPNIKDLINKVTKFKGYGVEIELKSTFELYNKNPIDNETFKYIGVRQQEQIINRVKLLQPILQSKTFKILWDDDHPTNNIYVVKILEQIGFKIETASTSEAGLELLATTVADTTLKRYDLIISDYSRDNPNDKNGLVFADSAKQIDYSIPIIFFSASYDEKTLGIPQSIFAVSHRPDYLINYILDVIERGDTLFPR